MVKTRFQIMADPTVGQRAFKSYGDVARVIMKEEGPAGFFKGITASYVGCFEGAIQWIVYEKLKSVLCTLPPPTALVMNALHQRDRSPTAPINLPASNLGKGATLRPPKSMIRKPTAAAPSASASSTPLTVRKPHPAELFLAAAASKFTAVVATYPHEVVRTRLREQATSGVFKYRGFTGALRTIAREEGARYVVILLLNTTAMCSTLTLLKTFSVHVVLTMC